MIVVLQANGSVGVTATGLVKTSEVSPLPSGCCCDVNPDPECEHCLEGTIADEIVAEFAGLSNPTCCADINLNADSFILPYNGGCNWGYNVFCNFSYFMNIGVNITDTYIEVKINWERDGSFITFRREINGPINCTTAIAGGVPYFDHLENGDCGFGPGVTCTLSV
jgi:hypothetical protein